MARHGGNFLALSGMYAPIFCIHIALFGALDKSALELHFLFLLVLFGMEVKQ